MASFISEFVGSYRTLATVTNAYQSERPADVALPLITFRAYSGRADANLPTQEIRVQATAYAATQEAASLLAEGVRTWLHQKQSWDVGSYVIGCITCDPVVWLPSQDATGGRCYRAAVSMRCIVKPG